MGCSTTTQPSPTNFNNLVWADEFNGPDIDTSIWHYETYATGWRNAWNNELQNYLDDGTGGPNAFISQETDGSKVLTLRATRNSPGNSLSNFDSARITTQGTKSFTYGRIEARMALPKGSGIWPAFWMLGTSSAGWPTNGEIDIMEMIGGKTGESKNGGDNVTHTTLHWGKDPNHPSFGQHMAINDASKFHVYTFNWDENQMIADVDGQVYFKIDISGSDKACFHQPFYLLLNLAVGGNWPGNPDDSTVFPQDFKIDYIRVYQ